MAKEEDNNFQKISNGLISYYKFKESLRNSERDLIIEKEETAGEKISFIFRNFNIECYIIEKKILNEFLNSNNLPKILNPINEENIKKFNEELKEIIEEKGIIPIQSKIEIYSDLEKIKELVTEENFSLVNEEFLCDVMSVDQSNLVDQKIKFSNNAQNESLIFTSKNYVLNIDKYIESEYDEYPEEYKNLYYVEDITKKIFVLLYFNEIRMKEKIKMDITDFYNFKDYYLINKEWIEEYKQFFLYDEVIDKLENIIKDNTNEHNINYSYKKAKYNLNDIIYNIGQIRLYNDTKIGYKLMNAKKLIPKRKLIKSQNEKEYFIPFEFILINQDIYELLKEEEFFYNMNDEIGNEINYKILIGNNNLIILNKNIDSKNDECIVFEKDKKNFNQKGEQVENDRIKLLYILNYNQDQDEEVFNGLKSLNIENENLNQREEIKDNNGNILGNLIQIDKKYFNDNIEKNENIEQNEINNESYKIENQNFN